MADNVRRTSHAVLSEAVEYVANTASDVYNVTEMETALGDVASLEAEVKRLRIKIARAVEYAEEVAQTPAPDAMARMLRD